MKLSVTTKSALTQAGEVLGWDTEFWGVRVGRAYSSDIDQWAKENMVGSICLLLSADDTGEIQAAEQRGFRFMDIRVTLGRKIDSWRQYELANARPHAEDDIDKLVRIARESHRITRFYADPRFPNERCDDLYETWIRSSCAGWADQVLVVGDADGYVTLHVSDGVASIGLIAVDEKSRGQGFGLELLRGAIDWCKARELECITVVTQGRNIAAQRLFQRCMLRVTNTEVWLHKHYEAAA